MDGAAIAEKAVKAAAKELKIRIMKTKFLKKLKDQHLIDGSGYKSTIYSRNAYKKLMSETIHATNIGFGNKKTPLQARRFNRYQVMSIGGVKKLVLKSPNNDDGDNIRYVISEKHVFQAVRDAHINSGHGGRRLMRKYVKQRYANISERVVMAYKSLCEICARKQKGVKKLHVVVKPILTRAFQHRGQLDLIDMQQNPDGDFIYILVYIDHLTKFVQLRPLRDKTADTVVEAAISMMSTFGAPCILHTDNGSEVKNKKMVKAILDEWPGVHFVSGAPRHSECNGGVERCNFDVRELVISEMAELGSMHWARLLCIIANRKNNRYHTGTTRSAMQAVTGQKSAFGLLSMNYPLEDIKHLETEAELDLYVKSCKQQLEGGLPDLIDDNEDGSKENTVGDNVVNVKENADNSSGRRNRSSRKKRQERNVEEVAEVGEENDDIINSGNGNPTEVNAHANVNQPSRNKRRVRDGKSNEEGSEKECCPVTTCNGELTEDNSSMLKKRSSKKKTRKHKRKENDAEIESNPDSVRSCNAESTEEESPGKGLRLSRKQKRQKILNDVAERNVQEDESRSSSSEKTEEALGAAELHVLKKQMMGSNKWQSKMSNELRKCRVIVNQITNDVVGKPKECEAHVEGGCKRSSKPKKSAAYKSGRIVAHTRDSEVTDCCSIQSEEEGFTEHDKKFCFEAVNNAIHGRRSIRDSQQSDKNSEADNETDVPPQITKSAGPCNKCSKPTYSTCFICCTHLHHTTQCSSMIPVDKETLKGGKRHLCYDCYTQEQSKANNDVFHEMFDNMAGVCDVCNRDCQVQCRGVCGKFLHPTCSSNSKMLCELCHRADVAVSSRQAAAKGLKEQAEVMLRRSQRVLSALAVNDSVQVAVPKEDRGPMADKNVLGVILGEPHKGYYEVGTKHGKLERLVHRRNMQQTEVRVIEAADVPNKKIALRGSAAKSSLTTALGFIRCKCSKLCVSRICVCKRKGLKCGSNCHKSTSCCNKA